MRKLIALIIAALFSATAFSAPINYHTGTGVVVEPSVGPTPAIQRTNAVTRITDANYTVPIGVSQVVWNVPAQSTSRSLALLSVGNAHGQVPADTTVTFWLVDSNGEDVEVFDFETPLTTLSAPGRYEFKAMADGTWVLNLGTAAYVADSTLVHKTGAETLAGSKTFSDDLGIGVSPTVARLQVQDDAAGGRVAYFKSTAAGDPNTSFVLDAPTGFNPGVTLQENATDKFGLFYNSNITSGSRLADTFELYSFISSGPVLRVHQSAPPLSLAIDSAGVVSAGVAVSYPEQGSPPAAVANAAVVYAQDNGGGKTQLMVRFPTGSPVQIAIEP